MISLADKLSAQLARLRSFGKEGDDSSASIKETTLWLENLPLGDPLKSQQAISGELKRLNENPTQSTKAHLAIFMLLDEKSHDLQDTLIHQYLSNPRMSRQAESRLWHAVYGLYLEVAMGYHNFVRQLDDPAAGNDQRDELIPLLTLRAIRTLGQLLKWRAVRYLPANKKIWGRLQNLYRIAENRGFHRQPQLAYAEDASDDSCEAAYLHILMLNQANSGTLYPRQIDLLDRWLYGWRSMLQLDNRLDARIHNFVVDLSADHGPRRVRKPDIKKPLRFWSTAVLLQRLREIQVALKEGHAPAQLGLTENARAAESLELLDHLLQHWSPLASRERRRAPRAPAKHLIDVTHGLGGMIAQFKAAEIQAADSSHDAGLSQIEAEDVRVYGFVTERTRESVSRSKAQAALDSPDVERWVMQDESECGYGTIVKPNDRDWLRIGALIGVKSHGIGEWRVGIVRRLSRINDDSSSVGIETMMAPPSLVTLFNTAAPNPGASQMHSSLWLAGDNSQPESLLIDPLHYKPGETFRIEGIPGRERVAMGIPIERSEGWMRVAIKPVND
ncbi:MAG: hypothetical protein QG662_1852 [Pseudomonadota bacterium]|nr:hypothetical protein [Pseudomonadota bacterium]